MMQALKKFYNVICFAEELIAGLFIVLIMLLIFASGTARSLGHPLRWGMDAATFLFAWAAFFSADVALRKGRHIRVEALVKFFPAQAQRTIEVFNYTLIIIFLIFLIRFGVTLAYGSRFRTFQGIPGFSYMWVTLSVPVGSLLLLVTTVLMGKDLIQNRDAGTSDNP